MTHDPQRRPPASALLTLSAWGLPPDPWPETETADFARIRSLVRAAAAARAWVSVHGPRGAGKTHAVRAALRGVGGVQVAEPLRLDRERLHLGDLQRALVRDLSDESPRCSGEARSAQARRLLGAAGRGPAVLWIDDAHLLHHRTVVGLKRLRELSWRGRPAPLLGVVLTGQHDRTADLAEARLRSDRLRLSGLSRGEARAAAAAGLNGDGRRRIDDAALDALAAAPAARWWLDLRALAVDCLAEALRAGDAAVTADTVRAVLDPDPPRPPAPAAPDDDALAARLAAPAAPLRAGRAA